MTQGVEIMNFFDSSFLCVFESNFTDLVFLIYACTVSFK